MKTLKRIRDFKLQKKLVCICLICSMIPICLLGVLSYHQTRKSSIEREQIFLSQSLSREAQAINYKLTGYENSMNLMLHHETLQAALSAKYTNNYDMYIAYRDIIDPLIETIKLTQQDISCITIYTDCEIYPHGTILRPLSELEGTEWYKHVTVSPVPAFYLSRSDKTLYLICKMYGSKQTGNTVICQKIKARSIIASLDELCGDSSGLYLVSPDQQMIYENSDNCTDMAGAAISLQDIQSNHPSGDYIMESEEIPLTKWTLYLYEPATVFLTTARQIFLIVAGVIVLSMILCFITGFFLSEITFRPLTMLAETMSHIEENGYKTNLTSYSNDEIGHLIRTFQKMIERINYLINQVYKTEIASQKLELKVLQAQINPHFFYNCLSMINNQALLNGQESISRMALHLSAYYRTSLNNGKDFSTLRDELKNVNAYVEIMQMLRENSFCFIQEIEPETGDIPLPNLIIQPLIENAIIHGIDQDKEQKPGVITLQIFRQDRNIVIRVLDNGCGMSEEKCVSILKEESKHYGLGNIQKRIQLIYGKEYGITIQSTPDMGTSVSISFPFS